MRAKKLILRTTVRLAMVTAAVLVLGACIMEPDDDSSGGDGGSLTISVPISGSGVSGNAVSGSAITSSSRFRVWMYTPQGNEYRLAPTGTGIPNARNYVEAAGGGTVVIDKIPAGDGYGVVVAIDEDGGSVFVPTAYAFEGSFSVVAGRATQLALQLERVGGYTTALAGTNLNSVVAVTSGTNALFAASSSGVYHSPFSDETVDFPLSSFTATPANASVINNLSPVRAFDSVFLVNTDVGTFPMPYNQNISTYVVDSSYVNTGYTAGVRDVTGSGIFETTGGKAVAYYQRLGGLGGVEVEVAEAGDPPIDVVLPPASSDDWNDSGTDLSEVVAPDESPVWAYTTAQNRAYISSVMGTFRATEELFNSDDIDVDALLGGDSGTAGLTFFGVAYPGTSRTLRIREIDLISVGGTQYVVVGTGRGAFRFPESAINGANGGLVSGVQAIPQTDGQYIVDMSVDRDNGFIGILTPSRVVVVRPSTGAVQVRPLRAVTLGNPTDLYLVAAGGNVNAFIAGTDGLSRVVF